MNEESIEDFRWQVTFTYLSFILANRLAFVNDTCKSYIQDGKRFFEDIAKGLESIVNPEQGFHLVPYLKEVASLKGIVKAVNNQDITKLSRQEMIDIANQYRTAVENLDKLENNPKRFYEKHARKEKLSLLCRETRNFYDRKMFQSISPILGEINPPCLNF